MEKIAVESEIEVELHVNAENQLICENYPVDENNRSAFFDYVVGERSLEAIYTVPGAPIIINIDSSIHIDQSTTNINSGNTVVLAEPDEPAQVSVSVEASATATAVSAQEQQQTQQQEQATRVDTTTGRDGAPEAEL